MLFQKYRKPHATVHVYFGKGDIKNTNDPSANITTSGYIVLHKLLRYVPWCDFSSVYTYTKRKFFKFRFIAYTGPIIDVIFHQIGDSNVDGSNMHFDVDGCFTSDIDKATLMLHNILD